MADKISDLELLRRYMSNRGDIESIHENSLTLFTCAEDVYSWTNEPLKEYYAKDIKGKKVFAATSGGDLVLHAALGGADDITGFDINRFAKYIGALKVAMVRTYDYDNFFEMFGNENDTVMYMLGYIKTSSADMRDKLLTIYNDSSYFLSDKNKEFFEEYFKLNKQKNVPILKTLQKEHHTNNAYCNREEYDKLRKNLSSCNIKFIDSNIDCLHEQTKEKADLMYISNIIGSIVSEKPEVVFNIIRSLQKNLNEGGIIYDYHMPLDSWRHNIFTGVSTKRFNEILSKELPDFEIWEEELSRGSIYKFKYKGQPK